ncbi:proton-conducting transporter membrane subunit [Polyangium aurulentum]|uniref:proton-conducting transporter transmembrane domain-containing protein n=1 Tax=Polyangium aurulentum TaxID=2567896 RepID=UPI0010AE8CDA|nr:proton-conducting transporter membrane subunit [Polyangium aurulentum]UQA60948.1 NADH-quinone oxidoreductase subunit L [Polyangium aurulentum]
MSELAGQLTHVDAPLTPLGLIPLALLLGAAASALLVPKRPGARRALATSASVGSTLLALVLAIANVARLVSLTPERRYLHDVGWSFLRIGSLDASLAFSLDSLSALLVVTALVTGALVQAHAARVLSDDAAYARLAASSSLLLGALSLLLLGDNFVVALFGWEGAALATYLLIGARYQDPARVSAGTRAFVLGRAGDVGIFAGVALLFWGMGGAWLDEGRYLSDYRPRFVAVHGEGRLPVEEEEDEEEREEARERAARDPSAIARRAARRGQLTFTSFPGARVYLGVADLAQLAQSPPAFGTAPFVRKEIPAGVHAIVIVPGDGATVGGDGNEAAMVEHVVVDEGEEVVIVPLGPTISFREITDQLTLRDAGGRPILKDALLAKEGWGAMGLVTLACLLLFAGIAAKGAQLPLFAWLPEAASAAPAPAAALVHLGTVVASVYFLARLDALFSMSPTARAVVCIAGAVGAVLASLLGALQRDLGKAIACVAMSGIGLGFVVASAGAAGAAAVHAGAVAVASSALFLVVSSVAAGLRAAGIDEDDARDLRLLRGIGRVLPGAAQGFQLAALAVVATESLVLASAAAKGGASVIVLAACLVAAVLVAFILFRCEALAFAGAPSRKEISKKVKEPSGVLARIPTVLALGALALAIVLGMSGDVSEGWLFAALALGGAIFVRGLARRRYGEKRAATWIEDEEKIPGAKLVRGEGGRRISEGLVEGATAIARGAAWLADRLDDLLLDGPARLLARKPAAPPSPPEASS